MTKFLRLRAARGFTLIELLIVVIIIAILAAIAIPQFSNSSADAQEAALDANLATVRSAIELYRAQHASVFPGVALSSGGASACTTAGGVLGTGTANSDVAMKDQMIGYSTASGQTCTVPATGFLYGPYMRTFPNEPISASNAITVINGAMTAPALAGLGWRYSLLSGQFTANSLTLDRSGTRTYSAH
jgi:general secretion pathway protein G